LPEFSRATVDGYALMARDTFGAGASQPSYSSVIGEVAMGTAPEFTISDGQCSIIHTGGMLPHGADAVIMLENTQHIAKIESDQVAVGEVEIMRAVAPGENIITAGEDVQAGEVVLHTGREIRAQDIGGLAALGVLSLYVRQKPRVGIISTGDEVVEPRATTLPGQVRDVNGPVLAALVADHGAEPVEYGIVTDEPGRLQDVARQALQACDMVVITAGSSASARDLTAAAIQSLGDPGVLVHGIGIRPGKPTILGACGGKPVIGLPGNPVSAFVVAKLLVLPAVAHLLGRRDRQGIPEITAKLSVNLASQTGREDWWPVTLQADPLQPEGWLAVPVFGRSNLIFNLVEADGLIRIAPHINGLESGALVHVLPL
jgi:molybdopterin molybdotransferase